MKRIKLIFLVLTTAVITLSCKKEPVKEAKLKIINMSLLSGSVNNNINDALFTGNISFGGPVNYYRPVGVGTLNLKVNSTNGNNIFLNAPLALSENKYYSAYLYDSSKQMKISLIEDSKTPAPTGKCQLRLLNLLINSPAVDIVRGGGPATLFTNRTYTDHLTDVNLTAYTAIDPGPFSCAAIVSGSANTLIAFLPSFDATAGKNYTMVLRGAVTANPLSTENPQITIVED